MGVGVGEGGQEIQTCRYEVNKSWGCRGQHGDSRYSHTSTFYVCVTREDVLI